MKAGILAAGQGTRLKGKGIMTPKPLVMLGGMFLIERLLHEIDHVGIRDVVCIVNAEEGDTIEQALRGRIPDVALTLIKKTTASSFESFMTIKDFLLDETSIVFTVDAIFRSEVLQGFLDYTHTLKGWDAILTLTDFIDDEKPLRVVLDEHQRIAKIGEKVTTSRYITSGIYAFTPEIFAEAQVAEGKPLSSLRSFLTLLVEKGYRVFGYIAPKMVDVDRPEDIEEGERYLREQGA
ncbi:MAG: NDP-sugar synthase [Candidatus Tectomicrobia bacterium]|nr:NDP-sugar synthase [Candidatus Tectomicrobia bacterium]